jgi:hypothetical protein
MDIAYYISDLLGQQGELSVPNLGYFVQIRMNAYYDEKAGRFFPPHYAVKFDPQVIDDDDTLASYITNLKKISLASAKYFIEKYISNLKSQVIIEDVPFATLGSFSSDGVKLSFHAGAKTDDPSFFGFTDIAANKIGQAPAPAPKPVPVVEQQSVVATPVQAPVEEQPVTPFFAPPIAAVEETAPNTPEEYLTYEDEPAPRSMSIWIILLIVFTVLAIAFVTVFKLRPDLLKSMLPAQKDNTEKATAIPAPAKHTDTIGAQLPIAADTSAKPDTGNTVNTTPVTTQQPAAATTTTTTTPVKTTPAQTTTAASAKPAVTTPVVPVVTKPVNIATEDTVAKGSWVIYNGAFPTKSGAEGRIDYDKGKGFAQARLLKKKVGPGGNYKVILGAFKTKAEATSASQDLIVTGKIKKTDLSIELYK